MITTATRLITLIMTQQRQPVQKAADVVEELGVSLVREWAGTVVEKYQ